MRRLSICSIVVSIVAFTANSTTGQSQFPQNVAFKTLTKTTLGIQALAGDHLGNLYAAGRDTPAGQPCPVWRINPNSPSPVVVGFIPPPNSTTPCFAAGLARNDAGEVFGSESRSGRVFRFSPNESSPPTATLFGTAPGALSIAFDRFANLWVTDGTSNQGRVWKIPPSGGEGVVQFRVPTLRNSWGVGRGVIRSVCRIEDGSPVCDFPKEGGSAGLAVAHTIVFNQAGDMFISDNTRGAIWKVEFHNDGTLKTPTGCDSTYPTNTLCLESLFIQHPLITGVSGITLDQAGNIWAAVIDRNAIAFVTKNGRVSEIFRNPVMYSYPPTGPGLRNEGPLEFPSKPFLVKRRLCVSNFDSDVQDNSPNSAGELNNPAAGPFRGKISCMDPEVAIPGLPLP